MKCIFTVAALAAISIGFFGCAKQQRQEAVWGSARAASPSELFHLRSELASQAAVPEVDPGTVWLTMLQSGPELSPDQARSSQTFHSFRINGLKVEVKWSIGRVFRSQSQGSVHSESGTVRGQRRTFWHSKPSPRLDGVTGSDRRMPISSFTVRTIPALRDSQLDQQRSSTSSLLSATRTRPRFPI